MDLTVLSYRLWLREWRYMDLQRELGNVLEDLLMETEPLYLAQRGPAEVDWLDLGWT